MYRIFLALCLALSCLGISACAAAESQAPQPVAEASAGNALPAPAAAAPVEVVTSCRTDADCTVKDVGNCCGYYPACVNRNSPTDPQGVLAQCQAHGRMSVCGFAEINACQCVSGQCRAAGDAASPPSGGPSNQTEPTSEPTS